ncbi:class I adenylate-forming enzyme family protein [Nocardia vaccinii]|uniref:class I adenylate-forming enzyme family protein n=1 Tax=Nocardia vaccinii TaxID=1822 RepID=UPI0008303164|nr:AMP-binding protein [Nocardia vaccinii]
MPGDSQMLRRAERRAQQLRPRYRSLGLWSGDPVDVVRDAGRICPDAVAVVDRSGPVSYRDLDSAVDRACLVLYGHGVGAGAVVLVVVGNDIASVVAVHAVSRSGAIVLVVPRSAGWAHIADIVARSGASVGIAPRRAESAGPSAVPDFEWIDVGEQTDPQPCPTPTRPSCPADEPSFVLYTSGTTSRPKGVIHSLSTLMKASANYIRAAGLDSRDRIFLISPLASVTGVLQALFVAPMLRIPVILEDRWDPSSTCEFLLSSGATWYGGPDRLLNRLLDEAVAAGRPVPLRAVFLGGTMLDHDIVARIEDEFGIVVMRAYGSSEAPVSVAGTRGEPRSLRHADDGAGLAHVDVRVGSYADPTECCIRGPHVFLGYTDEEDDRAAFDGEWFRTGDVIDHTGGRVRVVGRLRDIVIRNGLKIPIGEVDEAIRRITGVLDCAAYSVPDPVTGERLAAAVVIEPGVTLSLGMVAGMLLAAGLPKYKLPEELVLWNEPLPMNANGKVERAKLDAGAAGRPRDLAERLSAEP